MTDFARTGDPNDTQYMSIDKKQLEYMKVVNLLDVKKQSQLRDR